MMGSATSTAPETGASGQDCALKLVRIETEGSDEWIRRFENEVAAILLLDHPGIVHVRDAPAPRQINPAVAAAQQNYLTQAEGYIGTPIGPCRTLICRIRRLPDWMGR